MVKKRVLIIGGGASGLIAVKEFGVISEDFHVVCMEQLPVVGGLWNYSDITQADQPTGSNYTAVYKQMKTNIPKQIMNFSDIPFPPHLPSFIHHSDVKSYLCNYSKTHNLDKFIKFNKKVTSVKPKALIGREDVWEVDSINVLNKKTETYEFDIVIVCNGHYSEAIYPKNIKGMEDFGAKIIHSQHYRDPEDYRGKKVMVVGAGLSGVDIVCEICLTADKTWFSHRMPIRAKVPDWVEQVGEVVEFKEKDLIIDPQAKSNGGYSDLFEDFDSNVKPEMVKSSIRRAYDVDVVVFCTGYSFKLPFLNADSGVAVMSSNTVGPLYKDLICLRRQSLCFIGLQGWIITFRVFEHEAKFLRHFYEGKIKLPKYGRELLELVREEEEARRNFGLDVVMNRHQLGGYQWDYMDGLADEGGFERQPRTVKRLCSAVSSSKKESLMAYKDIEYEMGPDGFYERSPKKIEWKAPKLAELPLLMDKVEKKMEPCTGCCTDSPHAAGRSLVRGCPAQLHVCDGQQQTGERVQGQQVLARSLTRLNA